MTKEEYVEGKIKAGHILHENDGVWWETTRKGYCKPAVKYEIVRPRAAKPAFAKRIIGYNHRVEHMNQASGYWQPFLMKEEGINSWSLDNLSSGNRRRRIRKGLRNCTVEVVKDIHQYKEDISRILKSTAIRNGHGFPPEYYDMEKKEWWEVIEKVALYTEFWCAFSEGKLIAYICLHVMGERVVVDGVKSDTDFLSNCPIDAILHGIMTSLKERGGIKEMWYGGKSSRKTLDDYKESYGFEVVKVPYTIRLGAGLIKYPKFMGRNLTDK